MEEKFTGMMITLKKRMVCTNHDDTAEFQYLMFGHYDGADIACTDQWYQLRPKGVADRGGNVDIGDSFWDKYTIKLYFPESQCCQSLEKDGFAYNIWEKLGYYDEYQMECEKVLNRYPFLSIAMINLSEKCVCSESDLTLKMQKAVTNAAKQTGVDLSQIHCAIMPSIGYADFVLLFLSDDLKKVISVLDNLKKASVNDGGKVYAMLSNSYAISGFAKAGLENLHNLKGLEDVRLSIRVNLRDGISASQFKSFFDQELKKVCGGSGKEDKEEMFDLYQVFGNSDCLILSDMPFDFFIPLFYDKKLLNPAHELFCYYIQHTRSSVRVKIELEEERNQMESEGKEKYIQYQGKFQRLIDKLKQYADEYDIPIRIVNGLQTVMKAYLSLIQFSHCFDIEKVMGAAFEAVEQNVSKTLEIIKFDSDKRLWYSEQMLTSLALFREKIEDYLSDLRRSDRLFIEGQSLSHPSIGSATKLLFFYNCFINNIAEKLVQTEKYGKASHFTFLVTSGGCDVTTAYDLFSYMDPMVELVHPLIVVSIPEMSLYDFRGTMFRLLHECFHFCGERRRRERLDFFLKSLSENTAWVISNGLRKSFDCQLKNINHISEKFHLQGDREKIRIQGEQIVQKAMSDFAQKLKDELYWKLEKEFEKKSSSSYYGRKMYYEVMEELEKCIWDSNGIDSNELFFNYVYHKFLLCQNSIAERWKEELAKWSILFSDADLLRETSFQKQEMEKEGKFDREEEAIIREVFRNYVGGSTFEGKLVNLNEDERITEEEIVSTLEELFKECYADCMAAEILKLPVEDFLLCFLYETWDYEKAFPYEFRIAMDLKVLYCIDGKLDKGTRQKIKEKVLHWEKLGFQYQRHSDDYIESVCNWIDGLLKTYQGTKDSLYVGIKYVEEYLYQCRACYGENFSETIIEISNWSNMFSTRDIYKLLEKVGTTWRNIAK